MNDFLLKYATQRYIEANRASCFYLALQDARTLNGRDRDQGQFNAAFLYNNNGSILPNSLICIVCYLIVLEMTGTIFKRKDGPKCDDGILQSLHHFSAGLSEKEKYTVKALRNSLAHNYGLMNIPEKSEYDSNSLHKFKIDFSKSANIIDFGKKKINREIKYNVADEDEFTKIGYFPLIDFFEQVYSELINQIEDRNVELSLKDGKDELFARFTVII